MHRVYVCAYSPSPTSTTDPPTDPPNWPKSLILCSRLELDFMFYTRAHFMPYTRARFYALYPTNLSSISYAIPTYSDLEFILYTHLIRARFHMLYPPIPT